VLLIERGNAAENFASRHPTLGSAQSFVESTVTSPIMKNREIEILGGRALGGVSRVNGTRGVAGEFNEWSAEGRKGWSYDEIEP
jgi:choline dehydrogenase